MPGNIVPFRSAVSEAALDDLRERLRATRWPREVGDNRAWQAGANLAFMRRLVAHWLDTYEWRRHEAEMNRMPQIVTTIDGIRIHFIHLRGRGQNLRSLILTHGWPWTFGDLHKVIGPLTDLWHMAGAPRMRSTSSSRHCPASPFRSRSTTPTCSSRP